MTNYLHIEAHKGLGYDRAGEAAVWLEKKKHNKDTKKQKIIFHKQSEHTVYR